MKKDGVVPEGFYRVPIGKGIYRRRGSDVTIVGASHAIELGTAGGRRSSRRRASRPRSIDLRTIKPLDEAIILESLQKTGRLRRRRHGVDEGRRLRRDRLPCRRERVRASRRRRCARIGLPDVPTPAGYTLEQFYYPDAARIAAAIARSRGTRPLVP